MNWQEGVAIAVVLIRLGAEAFLVAQRPSFWLAIGVRFGQALLPRALKYLTRRMPPEEAAWREAERRGQGDEWLKERLRSKRQDPSGSSAPDKIRERTGLSS
jgi:hypothetical protein